MIPVNEPLLDGNEKKYLEECIDTGWISSEGPFIKRFEDEFAKYVGCKYGVAVCNGTAALETALYAAGLGADDEIIMPSFTIISCAIAAIRLGAKPVFVDSEPETWNIDVSKIEEKVTKRTKAIMPVHIYGHSVNMDPVLDIANKYKLIVVEDAAEVHGAEYKGKKCGSIGHIAAFSFYANKIITTGEGGMVITNDELMAVRAKSYRNLCFKEPRFVHDELGYNFRMTSLQAAVGLAQLERVDEFVEIKRNNAEFYTQQLKDIKCITLPVERDWAKNVYWMYAIVLKDDSELTAKDLAELLKAKGIMTRPFFIGLHQQPILKRLGIANNSTFPVTERISKKGLYLPSGLTLTKDQMLRVSACLREALAI